MKYKFTYIIRSLFLGGLAIATSAHGAGNPAKSILKSDAPMLTCQFAVLPWFVGQQYIYDSAKEKLVLSKLPQMPELYYPTAGRMNKLDLQFTQTSFYFTYTGPQRLKFYIKLPSLEGEEEPQWKPLVITSLSTTATQQVVILDFRKSEDSLVRGISVPSDQKSAPDGSLSFVNTSNVPVIVITGDDKHKVRPYGQFLHQFKETGRSRLTVKAATIIDNAPKVILNRRFIITDQSRLAYFVFPTDDSLKKWRTQSLEFNSIGTAIAPLATPNKNQNNKKLVP